MTTNLSNNLETIINCRSKIKLYVLDYDGTIFKKEGSIFNHKKAFLLIREILLNKKNCLVLTARCASFLKTHLASLKELYKKNNKINSFYIGGGNGSILYKFSSSGLIKIFDNGLKFKEAKKIMELGSKIYKDQGILLSNLNKEGISIHNIFLNTHWSNLIPRNYIDENKKYKGLCFSEEAKVAFVLPKDFTKHKKIIYEFKNKISRFFGKRFSVQKGDNVFLQINRYSQIDQKLFALKIIIKKLILKKDEIFVFGNMPSDNDNGILIKGQFPYTFTNSKSFYIKKQKQLPYYLGSGEKSIHDFVIKSLQ